MLENSCKVFHSVVTYADFYIWYVFRCCLCLFLLKPCQVLEIHEQINPNAKLNFSVLKFQTMPSQRFIFVMMVQFAFAGCFRCIENKSPAEGAIILCWSLLAKSCQALVILPQKTWWICRRVRQTPLNKIHPFLIYSEYKTSHFKIKQCQVAAWIFV